MLSFDYIKTDSLDAATMLLRERENATPIAGGMTLLPTIRQGLADPSLLVDVSAIPGLDTIEIDDTGINVGAMARHADVASSAVLQASLPALAGLAAGIGDPQVRNCGTVGGSIANADPAADYPAAVLALDAAIRTTERTIAADEFFTGLFETALHPNELIAAIRFSRPRRAAYTKFAAAASGYAIVGVFVAEFAGGVRVAVTGAGPNVFRLSEAEAALACDFRPDSVLDIYPDAAGLNTDIHAEAAYRAHLTNVMLRRAVKAAVAA
ncbi:MAG: FAD binding domain-containing protein [Pseudomonadota bacterium]